MQNYDRLNLQIAERKQRPTLALSPFTALGRCVKQAGETPCCQEQNVEKFPAKTVFIINRQDKPIQQPN